MKNNKLFLLKLYQTNIVIALIILNVFSFWDFLELCYFRLIMSCSVMADRGYCSEVDVLLTAFKIIKKKSVILGNLKNFPR